MEIEQVNYLCLFDFMSKNLTILLLPYKNQYYSLYIKKHDEV